MLMLNMQLLPLLLNVGMSSALFSKAEEQFIPGRLCHIAVYLMPHTNGLSSIIKYTTIETTASLLATNLGPTCNGVGYYPVHF